MLLDFATGVLDVAAREDVERHIDGCHACFEVVAALGAPVEEQAPRDGAGRYTFERVRGAGAMGTVYEAHDPVLARKVAVKVLRADLQPTEPRRLRLLREAQSLARIRHPNVVSVYDAGEAGLDVYIAMELIDGEPLGEHLRRRNANWREIVDMFVQAGQGLAAAHEVGLVHRDFKPSNVLVDARGRVVVTDFGLAASIDASDTPVTDERSASLLSHVLSATAARLGTPAYMAPEQFRGERVTARTDQFSFCVALVEALAGRRPFAATSLELETQAEGPALTGLPGPARLAQALARGLAFDPVRRYPSMRSILAELRRCQTHRRTWIAAALGVAAASATLTAGWIASRPPAGCVAPLAESWGPTRRDALAARLSESADDADQAFLRDSKRRALARLDDYAAELARVYAEVCLQLPRAVESGSRELRGQWTCLQSRRAAFEALTARLLESAEPALPSLLAAVGHLEPASECASPALALRNLPQPDDPALGLRAQAIRLELAVARVKHEAVAPTTRATIEALLSDSQTLGYAPLQAEVMGYLGRVSLQAFEYERAVQELSVAYALASAHGHEAAAAFAGRGLILSLNQLGRFEEGRAWALAIAPLHRTAEERIALSWTRGSLAQLDSQYDESQRYFDEAFALRATPEGAEAAAAHSSLDATLNMLYADLLLSRDDYAGARRHYERALHVQQERFGPTHAALPDLLTALAESERLLGDVAAAHGHLEEALELGRVLGIAVPTGWANLGEMQVEGGDFIGALASYRRARDTGPAGVFASLVMISEARALAELERHDESARACMRAMTDLSAELGPEHPRTREGSAACHAIEQAIAQARGDSAGR